MQFIRLSDGKKDSRDKEELIRMMYHMNQSDNGELIEKIKSFSRTENLVCRLTNLEYGYCSAISCFWCRCRIRRTA